AEASEKKVYVGLNYRLDRKINLYLDAEKFQIIFLKLVKKAIRCSRANSQVIISIQASTKPNHVDFIIEDSSEGLDPEDLQHIFDGQFLKEKNRLTSQYGIVPALVKKYAQLFGAEISVHSKKGRGTTFIFTFPHEIVPQVTTRDPRSMNHPKAGAYGQQRSEQVSDFIYHSPTPSKQSDTAKRQRSLILSNQESVLQTLNEYLESDYNLLFGRDREEAQELLTRYQGKIDFILCGGDLLFLNQFQLLGTIKSNHRWKRLPVFVISDEIRASVRIRSLVMGIDSYIVSPFQKDE
ncbi:MAG: hybrid sensor histidine kinase/response regulator, partial [Bacteroidota bacterium]